MEKWKEISKAKWLEGKTWPAIVTETNKECESNLSRDKIRTFIRNTPEYKETHEYKHNEKQEDGSYKEVTEILPNGNFRSDKLLLMSIVQQKDPDYLLKAHGFDISEFELVSARNNIWNVYSKQDGIQQLYSSKITVKPRTEISFQEIKQWYESLAKNNKRPQVKPFKKNGSNKLLVIHIDDLHVGKLGWIGDSGENYDHKIASKRFYSVIDGCLEQVKGYEFELVYFVWSHDFFHIDNVQKSTSAMTPQDTDIRPKKIFKFGAELLIEGLQRISDTLKCPVETFYVEDNHGLLTSYHALFSLWCYFNGNKNIKVDLDPLGRKWKKYGATGLGFLHGNDIPKTELHSLMSMEAPKIWGATKYHEIHKAHDHRELTEEKRGVIVRSVSSVSGTDGWHYKKAYIGTVKKSQHFIYDKKMGLEQIIMTPVV